MGDRLESRRRFLKIGLGAVPVIVTLAARPARATVSMTGVDDYGTYGYGAAGGSGGSELPGDDDDHTGVTRPGPRDRRDPRTTD